MAMLDQLKLTEATPKKDRTPLGRSRRRLADALDLQIELAKADSAGTTLSRTRRRWIKNEAGGKDLRETPVRVRRWWWKDDAGVTFVAMKQGTRVLEIAPGKKAIEVGPADELPGKLAILRRAVVAGELDAVIGPVATSREQQKKKVSGGATKAPAVKA